VSDKLERAPIHIGVTGTRDGATPEQHKTLGMELANRFVEGATFHHGAAVGVDFEAHILAWTMGYAVVAHPPVNPTLRAWVEESEFWDDDRDVLLPELPYLKRDLEIVKAVELLIVVPNGPYRAHSGTWWTRSAAQGEGVPTVLINPDGSIALDAAKG
jgi:hypothetical protein